MKLIKTLDTETVIPSTSPYAGTFSLKFRLQVYTYRIMSFQVVAKMRNLSNQNELKPVPTTVIHIPS